MSNISFTSTSTASEISSVTAAIEGKVRQDLEPSVFVIENESHMHAGPATDSHFKVTVVTDKFIDIPRVKRHQRLYTLLADELEGEVHALALHLYTPEEWDEQQRTAPDSPACRGGH